jgi:dynein heavy chain
LCLQVAKVLVEFETLWHQAWLKGIEQQRSGLSAPLLVRHPDSGQLLVNLDKELMQLIRCGGILRQLLMAIDVLPRRTGRQGERHGMLRALLIWLCMPVAGHFLCGAGDWALCG